ncbi:thiol peroxidase, atypical 2-Cys peroxiredoxin [Williamsoniiplasma somnilux]|uniref:Thiol peroxidase, atypical 2-Cys peroxiredoxin n=1 Tax=Williamsoniiplasma somnilux TaxID=215578 RepID=A0A2K8P075_9MOLU|nr:redoxin family protein [Williamsoniiplasma somnilux]ATZ18401.1 thiol peroxidase, atypical 2-Cys peroxiredoxin [Williamsoniiplasma somnilux]
MNKTLKDNVYDLITKDYLKLGDVLPNFRAMDEGLNTVELKDINKKYKLISSVPSVDTSICILQTEKFNNIIGNDYNNLQLITISRDLPFALKKACASFKTKNHLLWSDANYRDYGRQTGFEIDFIKLLARAVIVLDENNKIIYEQIVNPPAGDEPNYNDVIKFLNTLK